MPDQDESNLKPKVIFDPNFSPWEAQYRSNDGRSYFRDDVLRNITEFQIKCTYSRDKDCECERGISRTTCKYITSNQEHDVM